MAQPEVKTETRKYFRTYEVKFGEQIDLEDEDALIFQSYVVVADKVKKKVPESNQKSEFHSRNPTEERQTVGNIKIEEKVAVKGLEELKAKNRKEN